MKYSKGLMYKIFIIVDILKLIRSQGRYNLKTVAAYRDSYKLPLKKFPLVAPAREHRFVATRRFSRRSSREAAFSGADVRPTGQLGFKFSPKDKKL